MRVGDDGGGGGFVGSMLPLAIFLRDSQSRERGEIYGEGWIYGAR